MTGKHVETLSIRGFAPRPHLGAAAHRRALGEHLRQCRISANLTGKYAARRIGTSAPTVSRLEKGERTEHAGRHATALLGLCGITDRRELSHALSIAAQGERPDVWEPFGGSVARWVQPLLALEPAAQRIMSYEPQLVPGWLQTTEYAQLVMRAGFPDASQKEIEDRAAARVSRLKMFLRAQDPPALVAVMDEDVLRRPAGSPGVMYRQIEHLIALLKSDLRHRISLHIAPLSMGMTGAVGHPIVHLRFADELLSDFVYLEQSESARCVEGEGEAERYQSRIFSLSCMSHPADQTLTQLEDRLDELAVTLS
ncbi:helix-turn-helix transcriptional regulator [Streptomyces sp. BE147]|uniref:helix-turn-helix domain-containing protein n=1 Tax=unclassified Streptomyces TaxID=2593676 RepID=UPI002E79966C|nr:helix-turn-helix transcriptional regulator [Streptomyces sp. BE147]MEE1736573.1 helix-turn-helix transcriptional regulator [Streptomyces sp. BE147]